MSDPEKTEPAAQGGDPGTTPTKRPWLTGVAFLAVAALAATGGALIAGGGGGGDDSAAVPGSTGGEIAAVSAQSLATGEHRGFDDVHQGGTEDLENVLVGTDWLAEKIEAGLEENDIVLIDISENLASSELTPYAEGHIPGAQYVDWGTDVVRENLREFVTQDEFAELARGLGISDDSTVVLYGDNDNWFAAYGAWLFKLYGVPDVRLLDGGLKKWEQVDGRELVQEVPQYAPGTFEAKPQNFDLRAFQAELLDVVVDEHAVSLVDIRSASEYSGEAGVNLQTFPGEGATVWGHIPSAVNVPWGAIVEDDGTYKSADEIRRIYEEAGVDLDNPVVTYCRIGERASHTWFALSQILGAEVAVYDGSWSEWGNSVGVPVQNDTGRRGGLWG
ncbi:sulfurtransferase [Rhodococcus triatomae]|uniref:Thiosulfate/3-mercaptopyruvate sulfurtransferase n=1 Tax=Rhodococcus triatomae TaxID=300028 RepID=A0A1G7ZQ64_9NOCA|nr:sulfurtransferase [Rhodococcus triatomae]QNG17984.1 sulfurtransferase [Rhodococcus triatomae]QNG22348.1 sulfurtransferase [Rhodococcus triatomae]SDH10697.1 thiosulfate/3-mercaptopyruvate sulfurtransferase [Rhodococcus triatomae]